MADELKARSRSRDRGDRDRSRSRARSRSRDRDRERDRDRDRGREREQQREQQREQLVMPTAATEVRLDRTHTLQLAQIRALKDVTQAAAILKENGMIVNRNLVPMDTNVLNYRLSPWDLGKPWDPTLVGFFMYGQDWSGITHFWWLLIHWRGANDITTSGPLIYLGRSPGGSSSALHGCQWNSFPSLSMLPCWSGREYNPALYIKIMTKDKEAAHFRFNPSIEVAKSAGVHNIPDCDGLASLRKKAGRHEYEKVQDDVEALSTSEQAARTSLLEAARRCFPVKSAVVSPSLSSSPLANSSLIILSSYTGHEFVTGWLKLEEESKQLFKSSTGVYRKMVECFSDRDAILKQYVSGMSSQDVMDLMLQYVSKPESLSSVIKNINGGLGQWFDLAWGFRSNLRNNIYT